MLSGAHFVPPRKLKKPISIIAGRPFTKIKKQIRRTAKMEAQAVIKNTTAISCSSLFVFIPTPLIC